MDITSIVVLSLLVLVAALFIVSRLLKKPTLEGLRLHYGEKIVFDDDNCTVDVQDASGTHTLPDIFIRVTNQRVIIAQRIRGRSGNHLLRYAARYALMPGAKKPANESNLKYTAFKTEPTGFCVDQNGSFNIDPAPGQGNNVPERLCIKSDHMEHYRDFFQK